jgi:predicted site-specific integrase-resolvase
VLYARVSSNSQRDDLERQVRALEDWARQNNIVDYEVVTDIGSGLNEDRKGFKKILKLAVERKISKIVIAYPDRLTRFGFKTIEELLRAFGVEVVVLNHEDKDAREELVEDLITIISHFAGRLYGMRSHKYEKWLKVRESSLKTLKQVRMYSIPVSDSRVSELITWYLRTLQRAIDIIWESIDWRYRLSKIERRKRKQIVIIPYKLKVPELPKSKSFKKKLRDDLLQNCPYARHWVDAVIRTAYSIMESWRKRYIKGGARKVKPRVKKRFARCKTTLMSVDYEEKKIRITVKPGEYIEVSWSSRWFTRMVEGWRIGEVVLKDDRILIPFKSTRIIEVRDVIAWDSNELSLDGFSPRIGFIRVDLKPLQSMKITYEKKKRIAQSRGLKDVYEKYVARERNKERDFVNKLASGLTRLFPNTIHVFEDLDKEELVSRRKNPEE